MPSSNVRPNIKDILDSKPVNFTLKTSGGRYKCSIHPNRASLDRSISSMNLVAAAAPVPGVTRTGSGLSVSSTSSSSTVSSSKSGSH
ncbi:hypothetical protein F5Y18DRAFT_342269 [Xylariaceae sp. FL1019]|nr:hypothetical protein F5Y18DRAFT_342269 [Xylariaceae sp. FL1019]